jgi:hypothetical protein
VAESRAATSESRRRWILAAAIIVWTAVAWGGRIGLLVGGADQWAWVRIGGSIGLGLLAGTALAVAPSSRLTGWFLAVFAGWVVVIWSRSLIVNWVGSGSLPFKLVHTVLAVGFFALAWFAWTWSRRYEPPKGLDR